MTEKQSVEIATVEHIESLVYTIRGQQVMLDSDLAQLYGYEVRALNQQVKRNKERFPEDFMFQLTEDEVPFSLRSQNATLNQEGNKRGTHRKYLPFVFTEQGANMLATVLKSEIAVQQSIAIMRTFREMRHYIRQNQQFITKGEMKTRLRTLPLSIQLLMPFCVFRTGRCNPCIRQITGINTVYDTHYWRRIINDRSK